MLHETVLLDERDRAICAEIESERQQLDVAPVHRWKQPLRIPRLWRATFKNVTDPAHASARLSESNAAALSAAHDAIQSSRRYQDALTLAVRLAGGQPFFYSLEAIRQFHHTICDHAPDMRPGRLRRIQVILGGEETDTVGHIPPPPDAVAALMEQMIASLNNEESECHLPAVVRAALAHLRLVWIHPFTDGNGRVARCLQTLVLARAGFVSPPFCSLDTYYDENAQLYNDVLDQAHREADPHNWIQFCLRGHLWQIARLRQLLTGLSQLHHSVANVVTDANLHQDVIPIVLDAACGRTVQQPDCMLSCDLRGWTPEDLVDGAVRAGLLVQDRQDRPTYARSSSLREFRTQSLDQPIAFADPYPP